MPPEVLTPRRGAPRATSSIELGPWVGGKRCQSADTIGREYMAGGTDYHYLPRHGRWRRRKGQTIKFEPSVAGAVGLLPAKWSGKVREFGEFLSDAITDGYPTAYALVTKETMASASVLDDGRFANFYVRDQVNSVNYTVGDEYSSTSYPVPGTVQPYKITPLWYDSGDGGISRGVTELARRFLFSGSRSTLKVGNWRYAPNLYGTPLRWREVFTAAASLVQILVPDSDVSDSSAVLNEWTKQDGSTLTNKWQVIDENPISDSDYIRHPKRNGTYIMTLTNPVVTPSSSSAHIMRVRALSTVSDAQDDHLLVSLSSAGVSVFINNGVFGTSHHFPNSGAGADAGLTPTSPANAELTQSFVTYEIQLTAAEIARITTYTDLTLAIAYYTGSGTGDVQVSGLQFQVGSNSTVESNRLMPSGPLPPTHAGVLVKGNNVTATVTTVTPSADRDDGTFTNEAGNNTNLYASIDETTGDEDSTYIRTAAGTDDTCDIDLTAWGITPAADDTVTVYFRARRTRTIGTPTGDLNMKLMEVVAGTPTERAGAQITLDTSFQTLSFTMTAGQIAAVSSWANTFCLRFDCTGLSANEVIWISRAYATHRDAGSTEGGWRGSDRFFYGVAYRAWDDSIWMPTMPRSPNDLLNSGFGLFTVDPSNAGAKYDKITWTHIPQPWYDMKSILLLRGDKIDSTVTDDLALSPLGLRITAEVGIGTVTYDDYKADDDALIEDPQHKWIRWDHIMPPRARYIFGGDMRVCHSYGGLNPCAIIIAPVGRDADYDLNDNAGVAVTDTSTVAYGADDAMYMRVDIDTSGVATLILVKTDGTTNSTKSFALATYDTLEKLVDAINATSTADTDWSGGAGKAAQWRAQLCPGVDPGANSTASLLPHYRAIASCVISGQTITKAAGGLSKVAVGDYIQRAGVVTGAIVTSIDSDTQLTFTGSVTSGTQTCQFYKELGDIPNAATTGFGYQRVIANCLPGFLYFNNTYLNQFPIEKSAVWMTVASPESARSAPNCFRGNLELTNKLTPPGDCGISMGGVGVKNGFIVPFGKKRARIVNRRDSGTGEDGDYRIEVYNETSGCCSWAGVCPGTDFALIASPEGIVAADLEQEILLTAPTWAPPDSDAVTGTGDFSYEMPLCVAATGSDTDGAYLSCKIVKGVLWVSYRASGNYPNRQVKYDFSSDKNLSGLGSLLRDESLRDEDGNTVAPAGTLYGWGLPCIRAVSMVAAVRRSTGTVLYGWNDENAGSTGDGRIDEIETGDTDNGTAITTANLQTPQLKHDGEIAGQEVIAEHSSPSGATVALGFVRVTSAGETTFTPSAPSTSSTLTVSRDLRPLSLLARVPATACYLTWAQSAGGAGELRKLTLRAKLLRRLKTT